VSLHQRIVEDSLLPTSFTGVVALQTAKRLIQKQKASKLSRKESKWLIQFEKNWHAASAAYRGEKTAKKGLWSRVAGRAAKPGASLPKQFHTSSTAGGWDPYMKELAMKNKP
jgi:hypothetical protein